MAQHFTVKKENNTLIYVDHGGYESRNPSTFWCIEQANKKYNWPDFKEITIYTGDYELSQDEYTYSKKDNYKNLIPDFNYHGWPQVGIDDYSETIKKIEEASTQPAEKHKVGWIGNLNTHPNRYKLHKIGRTRTDICDIFGMDWVDKKNDKLIGSKYISLEDLVKKYAVLIDIEGNGFSARLKYLLWSRRPVLIVDRPHKEYFFQHLVPYKHYIPVNRDLSDLISKLEWCLENYSEALEIANDAYEFSKKFLTRDACYEQWNKIITQQIETTNVSL
jgi:hypothetical protein